MEGDVVNQWVDAEELRKLAESLMVSAPRVNQSAPEAVYGDSFVGYTEVAAVPPCETGSPGRDAALRTLSEARGLAASAGIVYRQPASVEDLSAENVEAEEVQLEPVASRASDEMAAAEPAPQKFYKKVVSPFKITTQPMSQPTPQDAIVPAGPFGARSAASQQEASQVQVIASSLSPSGQPLSRRMVVFGDWLKASVPAEAFFVCDRNGEIISDEIGNEKLVKVARTLAHASSSASRQVGDAGGLTSPHVKIGTDRILQVIPKRSKFGLIVLGVIVPAPLPKDAVAAIAHSLSKTLGDEVLIPAQRNL
ncbi:MAG: hypothetical protein QNK61_02120 [Akkermansiaceae bacterium]